MEDRQHIAGRVILAKSTAKAAHAIAESRALPVAEHDPLGKPCGAACIHEDGQVVFLHIYVSGSGSAIG